MRYPTSFKYDANIKYTPYLLRITNPSPCLLDSSYSPPTKSFTVNSVVRPKLSNSSNRSLVASKCASNPG